MSAPLEDGLNFQNTEEMFALQLREYPSYQLSSSVLSVFNEWFSKRGINTADRDPEVEESDTRTVY